MHFASKDRIFANISFLGVDKLILAGLSYREFSKKFETARGTMIYEKNLKSKISCQTPLKALIQLCCTVDITKQVLWMY